MMIYQTMRRLLKDIGETLISVLLVDTTGEVGQNIDHESFIQKEGK